MSGSHRAGVVFAITVLWIAAPWTASALAQGPGQWRWDAGVGVGQRNYENSIDGSKLNESDQDELQLYLGLQGFIVHPAIAAFRLNTDLLLSQVDGSTAYDTERTGFGADLHLMPYGAFPLRLFAKRNLYDHTRPGEDNPFTLVGAPDSSTRWGGDFRAARGLLAGLRAGFERTTIDFLDPTADEEVLERQYLNWSRRTGSFQHRLQVERQRRDYGTVDLGIDDLTTQFRERAKISPTWEWEMYGSTLRRDLTVASGETTTEVYRLTNRFTHSVRARDLLDFRWALGATKFDAGDGNDRQAFSVFYRWRLHPAWEIAPFASYTDHSSGDRSAIAPRVGTSVTWRKATATIDAVLGGQVSYGQVERRGINEPPDESEFASSLTGSVGHGDTSGLRKELDFEIAHDELRLTRDLAVHLPDLGLPRDEIGTADYYRARVTLGHRWDSSQMDGWGEWNLRQSDQSSVIEDFEIETLSATLQIVRPVSSLQASGGRTDVRRGTQDDQAVSHLGVTWWLRPWRYLDLRTTYRTDDRNFDFTPDVATARYEVGAVVRFGQLMLDIYTYQSTERLSGGSERKNKGVHWTLSTRFGGMLPIFTGTKRRGVIR